MRRRGLAALALALLLPACLRLIPQRPPPTASPAMQTALQLGVTRGSGLDRLDFAPQDAAAALVAFRDSCPRLTSRTDASGLTRPADWAPACVAAADWPDASAAAFFRQWFEAARVGDGAAFATGYYEPELAGVRQRQPGFEVPIYGLPVDLVRAEPGEAAPLSDGRMPIGRRDESGRFVPYHDRAAIEQGALANRGLEIAWAADAAEVFFLQVQGSGRLRAPDGSVIRIGYAGANGHAYTGIGAVMRDRGLVGEGPGQYPGSMQGILRYIHDHPEDGRALMCENRSFVFFRELGPNERGPVGALNVPVRGQSSVAVDPRFVPLGAPVWLALDRDEADGLWIAQDIGGAIKGANRFDTFWGTGDAAGEIAGGMSARGQALVLVPRGTLDRLRVQ